MELSIIVPCLNEANLPELVRRIGEVLRLGRFSLTTGKPSPVTGEMAAAGAGTAGEASLGAELILIDDGSTDRSAAVMAELAAAHPFVRARHHPQNRGIAAAWKTGVTAARGHLVCLIEADLQSIIGSPRSCASPPRAQRGSRSSVTSIGRS